jgi:hypothetical protein
MVGDTRKKLAFPYAVTKSTVLEFDFKSGAQGSVHGIGLDDDDLLFENRWVQVDWGATSHTMPKEPSVPIKMVMELLPTIEREFPAIDTRRVYLVGLSMGGFGVWDLLARRPDWFAGAVPICGGADLDTANVVAPVPTWDFHGALDSTVLPQRSRYMIAALWNIGAEPRYTEYPEVAHNAWTRAMSDPELLPWLFAQSRPAAPPLSPTNLKAAAVGAGRVDLSWSAPPDVEGGIKEYRVLRDGGEIGSAPRPRFSDAEVGEGEVHNYTVVALNRGWLKSTPSPPVWIKVPADRSPLHLSTAEAQGSAFRVEVQFDKPADPKRAADPANYTLDRGVTVTSATLLPDQRTVRLETSELTPKTAYTVTVANVTDRSAAHNAIVPGSRAGFTYDPCLAAHWRLDEGDGAFSADATGNGGGTSGNTITFHSVDWVPGKWGKALNFDGAGSHYAWTLQSKSLDLTDGLTVALWVRKSPGQYGRQVMIGKSNYYDHRTQFMLDFDDSHRVRATVGTMDRGEVFVKGTRIDARDWHHIALTYGRNRLELFVDGKSQGFAEGGDKLLSVSEAITIGAAHQGRDPLRGALDEIRVYNRSLTPDEVRTLAEASSE